MYQNIFLLDLPFVAILAFILAFKAIYPFLMMASYLAAYYCSLEAFRGMIPSYLVPQTMLFKTPLMS